MNEEKRGKRVDQYLEVFDWGGVGYKPLAFEEHWQIAILNWEPIFAFENAHGIEAHQDTDEAFVLMRGKVMIFVATASGLRCEVMVPGKIYNVTRGTFHNLLATRDASCVVVETRDTDLRDTTIQPLTEIEKTQLRANTPNWALHQDKASGGGND